MTTIQVREKIFVEPAYLDANIPQYLYTKIKDRYVGKCNQNYGYVLSVEKKLKIYDNEISMANENTFFEVGFSIKSLKPGKKQRYSGKVCMVFQHGIFVEVQKYMKILVPLDRMKPYTYVHAKNMFQKEGSTIELGKELTVEIDMVKYEQKNFNCIGILIE